MIPSSHNSINSQKIPKVRLFLNYKLTHNAQITLTKQDKHYITNVMRLSGGDSIRVFNGYDGEWIASLVTDTARCELHLNNQIRPQESSPDLWLLFAPVKKTYTELIIQKATELGVQHIIPVKTQFTQTKNINIQRCELIAKESAEQSERLDIPEIDTLTDLTVVLHHWNSERQIIMGDENGGTPIREIPYTQTPRAALIGPAGGFSPEERRLLHHHESVTPVSLGARILKAETASILLLGFLN